MHGSFVMCFSLVSMVILATPAAETKSTSKWTKVPNDFRGVKFGATKAEAETVLGRLKCRNINEVGFSAKTVGNAVSPPMPPHTACATTDPAQAFRAGNKILGTEYLFDGDRFVAVSFRQTLALSRGVAWSDVLQVFKAEYGEPTAERTAFRSGTRMQRTSTWDPKQNKSVSKNAPTPYAYNETCVDWTDPAVQINLCAHGTTFAEGAIETAPWLAKRRALLDALLDRSKSK